MATSRLWAGAESAPGQVPGRLGLVDDDDDDDGQTMMLGGCCSGCVIL